MNHKAECIATVEFESMNVLSHAIKESPILRQSCLLFISCWREEYVNRTLFFFSVLRLTLYSVLLYVCFPVIFFLLDQLELHKVFTNCYSFSPLLSLYSLFQKRFFNAFFFSLSPRRSFSCLHILQAPTIGFGQSFWFENFKQRYERNYSSAQRGSVIYLF